MSKQNPFQAHRLPHQVAYTPGQPPQSYEHGQSDFSSRSSLSGPDVPPFDTSLPSPSQTLQPPEGGPGLSRVRDPYSATVTGTPQWLPIMPHTSGRPEISRFGPSAAVGGRQDTHGGLLSMPPVQTTSFEGKASRQHTDTPEAESILEEKRQRNTAASARFRIRKKERSMQMERALSELSTRAEELEREAHDLRRENTWLKEIVIMKGRQNLSTSNASPETSTSNTWRGNKASSQKTRKNFKDDYSTSGGSSDSE